jgi:hypothetical protein
MLAPYLISREFYPLRVVISCFLLIVPRSLFYVLAFTSSLFFLKEDLPIVRGSVDTFDLGIRSDISKTPAVQHINCLYNFCHSIWKTNYLICIIFHH